jgi:hypothetical protein
MTLITRKNVLYALVAIIALSVPLTIGILQRQQETRSRANASTTLSFTPISTAAPLQKSKGDIISLDLMVTPGTNLITFVKFQLTYDPSKLEPVSPDAFTLNKDAFLSKDGPIISSGSLLASASVGSDPTKAIKIPTKVGTIQFRAIGGTGSIPTTVTFASSTQALSAATQDQAAENVVSTTSPANIIIADNATTPSGTVTPSAAPTNAVAPTGTPLRFDLFLHGVGSSGDNPNPKGSDLSNKNPLHPQRNLMIEVYDTNNQLVTSVSGALSLNYNDGNGDFIGTIDLGANFKAGNYNLKVKTDRYLKRRVPGIQLIQPGKDNSIPPTDLVAGDINGDNFLNVIDYNAFLDCGYGDLEPLPIVDPNSRFNSSACQAHKPPELVDIDDNGVVNSADYNLFLRELSVQNGD